MYWIVSDIEKTRTLSIPYYVPGEIQDFNATLIIEDGETFTQAYLCLLDPFFLGYISAAIGTADYVELGGVYNSACFVGSLVGPTALNVAFRIEMDSTVAGGEYMIAIGMYSGQDCPGGPSFLVSDADETDFPLWGEDEHDSPLWNGASGPPPFWVSGSRCSRAEYAWVKPGVSLSKNDIVYVDDDKELQLALSGGDQAEAGVFGIIDDASTNYMHHLDGVVVSNGEGSIYWQGGHVGGNILDTVHRYDYLTRQYWLIDDTDLGGRIYHTGTWYGGKFYVWGGRSRTGVALNTIYVFDPTLVTWTALTAGGTARFLHGAMLVDDEIHFVGGIDASGDVVLSVDIYNITTNSWSTGTSAPAALSALDIALSPIARPVWQVCGNTLYYGNSTAGRDEQFFTYSSAGVWAAPAALADVATPGRNIAPNVPFQPTHSLPQNCVRLLPFGTYGMPVWLGMPTSAGASTADTYLEDCGKWSTMELDVRRVLTQGFVTDATWAFTVGQQQYLSATPGAWTTTRPEVSFITICGEAVSATTICFRPTEPFYTWVTWDGSTIAGDGINYLYEFGGDDGTGVTDRLRVLDLTTLTWTELTAGCTARTNAAMIFIAGILYVVGGIDADGNLLSTMCTYDTHTDTWTAAVETGIDPAYDQVIVAEPWPNDGTWAGDWTEGWTYFEDDVIYYEGVLYQAIADNVASATNEPSTGVNWEQSWEVVTQTLAWAEGATIIAGQMVTHGGATYVATSGHVTAAATEPGVGVDWETVWQIAYLAPEWVTGTEYVDNAIVESGGTYYVATSAHTAGASTKPGVGVDWDTVWDVVEVWQTGQLYAVGTVLYYENNFYTVTTEHTSAALTEPGVGDDWDTVFDLVDIDTTWQEGLSITAGDALLVDDVWYIASDSHTTTSADRPGSGANWEDHWTVAPQSQPAIYVVDGIEAGGVSGDVNILDTSTGIWIDGPSAPADFVDDMTVVSSDFENATEVELAVSADASNQWMCQTMPGTLVACNGKIYYVGCRTWTEGGEVPYWQWSLIEYDVATDTWGTMVDLTGDYTNGNNLWEFFGNEGAYLGGYTFSYDGNIYLFTHFKHIESEQLAFGAFRINPILGTMDYVSRCRSGDIVYDTTDRLVASVTYYDGKMYVYGGHGWFSNRIDTFNFSSFAWVEGTTDIGVERSYQAATISAGVLYLYGGVLADGFTDAPSAKITLATDAYAEWVIPEAFSSAGYITGSDGDVGNPSCYDDDGNLYLNIYHSVMFSPSTDTWEQSTVEFPTVTDTTGGMVYYSGALYFAACDEMTSDPAMYKIAISTTTTQPIITKTLSYDANGYPMITYTTMTEDGTTTTSWTFKLGASGTGGSGSEDDEGTTSQWDEGRPASSNEGMGIASEEFYARGDKCIVKATVARSANGSVRVTNVKLVTNT